MIPRVAERAPPAVGLKVTLIEQLTPAAKVDPQVVVRAKSALFAPVMEVAIPVRVVVPLFFNVTVCAALVVLIN